LLLEYKKRFEIYKENLVLARKMQDMEQGSAKYGETVFSDLTGLCLHVVGVVSHNMKLELAAFEETT